MEGLLEWIARPDPVKGMRLLDDEGNWRDLSYDTLARTARTLAGGLVSLGIGDSVRIAIILPDGGDFASAFFACLWAGHTPCPIASPTPFSDPATYTAHVAAILKAAEPAVIVTEPALEALVKNAATHAGLTPGPVNVTVGELLDAQPLADPRTPTALGLLQFTSGSSGTPRGVEVTRSNLITNIALIGRRVNALREDIVASWLPLQHDMGLIGCLLYAAVHGNGLQIMRPDQFIRDPARWLECFGRDGATLTAAPSFAYAYCCRHVRPEQLDGFDFSGWRTAIVGSDRVDPIALSRFAELLEPHGFRASTFTPAYGLAEATLAVNIGAPEQTPRTICLQRLGARGEQVVTERGELPLQESSLGDRWLVSCGLALDGLDVAVVDKRGRRLREGEVGEIVVFGSTVARGYRATADGASTRFVDGRLHTGDAGLDDGGELFVLGRIGDAIKVRGVSHYMEDLEEQLAHAARIPRGRLAVFSGADGDGTAVAVLVEAGVSGASWPERATRLLVDQLGTKVELHMLGGSAGCILRTSSGKPRRRELWHAFAAGKLDAVTASSALNGASA